MAELDYQDSGSALVKTPADLWIKPFSDGVAITGATTPTVVVTRADGTAVTSSAVTEGTGASTGKYTATITAANNSRLDTLTAVWSSSSWGTITTKHEVHGARLFTISEARAFDGAAMASATTYPTDDIARWRDQITADFERICGVSFVPKASRVTLDGTGTKNLALKGPSGGSLMLPTSVVAITTIDSSGVSTAFSATEITDIRPETHGYLYRTSLGYWASGNNNIVVEVEHGYSTPPEPIKRVALKVLRQDFVPSNIDGRATAVTEFGINWAMTRDPARRRWYGNDEIDSVLNDPTYNHSVPAMA